MDGVTPSQTQPANPVTAATNHRPRYSRGRCDRCGAQELHRSKPRTLVEFVVQSLSPFTPMRCPACGRRCMRHHSLAYPANFEPVKAKQERTSSRRRKRRSRFHIKRRTWRKAGSIAIGMGIAAYLGWYIAQG